jgi:predicted ATPase
VKKITLLGEQVDKRETYPFAVAIISSLHELVLRSRICFFAGENGAGKSTLLEAIAARYGFGREGGNRNFSHDTTAGNHAVDPLERALRLSFDKRNGVGYFLRAESFFNTTSYMDHLDEEVAPHSPPIRAFYGGRSLHTRSHGETFLTLLDLKFRRNGLFLLDEPEAALAPQRWKRQCALQKIRSRHWHRARIGVRLCEAREALFVSPALAFPFFKRGFEYRRLPRRRLQESHDLFQSAFGEGGEHTSYLAMGKSLSRRALPVRADRAPAP